jgi:methylated-DNA-[protein]-cysteine S-methyltransferase
MFYRYQESPIGRLLLVGDEAGLRQLLMDVPTEPWVIGEQWVPAETQLDNVCRQLDEYFAGRRQRFELRLAPLGTAFQRSVWQALLEIPFGQTWSYGQLARHIGSPQAMRAVGAANGANPIAVIQPCHRVIGSNGSLTGFSGGLERKTLLLKLEGWQGMRQAALAL